MAKAESGWKQLLKDKRMIKNSIGPNFIDKLYDGGEWVNKGVIKFVGDNKSESNKDEIMS